MASLNVPVNGRVKRLAADLRPRLTVFDRIREQYSLVGKRFESDEYSTLESELRLAFADMAAPAFEASVTELDFFETPTRGPGPVVYLTVESPGLERLHRRLAERFGAIPELEGDEYVPHVTLARGGSVADAERLRDAVDVEPVTWTVSQLHLYHSKYGESTATFSLPTSR